MNTCSIGIQHRNWAQQLLITSMSRWKPVQSFAKLFKFVLVGRVIEVLSEHGLHILLYSVLIDTLALEAVTRLI